MFFTPTAAEHVLKYVKEGYSYVNEFEEDCAADDKVCDYTYHCLTVFGSIPSNWFLISSNCWLILSKADGLQLIILVS